MFYLFIINYVPYVSLLRTYFWFSEWKLQNMHCVFDDYMLKISSILDSGGY